MSLIKPAIAAVVLAAGFHGGNAVADTFYYAVLSSAQEVPTNASTAIGFGRVRLNTAQTDVTMTLIFSGLSSNQTLSHIHGSSFSGANATVMLNIGTVGGTSGRLDVTSPISPAQLTSLQNGLTYFNIHSVNFSGGEIRGQIHPFGTRFFGGQLTGTQETPPVVTPGSGGSQLVLTNDGTQVQAGLQWTSISSAATMAHVHSPAPAGMDAPPLFFMTGVSGTANQLAGQTFPMTPIDVANLVGGQMYFNVHNSNNPDGEIRAQLLNYDIDLIHRDDFDS